jgi:hypothetical protein
VEAIVLYYDTITLTQRMRPFRDPAFPGTYFLTQSRVLPCLGNQEPGAGTLMVRMLQTSGRMEASSMNVVQLA